MENTWNIDKIKEILPQRFPFLFVDRVLNIDKTAGRVVCLKNVTINDYFFKGHFPDHPIMPGAIIMEALAQASILLFAALRPEVAAKHPSYFLAKIEARFLKPVLVGDQLVMDVSREKIFSKAGIVKARALVKNDIVASARIFFGVKLLGSSKV